MTRNMNNLDKARALLKSIETVDLASTAYLDPAQYTQHNLRAADGVAGFVALLHALPKGEARVNTVRAFQDGDYVVAHTDYHHFGPHIGFDIFRFEWGLIVEHWDNLQPTPPQPSPGGHSMLAAPPKSKTSTEPRKTNGWCAPLWTKCWCTGAVTGCLPIFTATATSSTTRRWATA
jgi:predicted SnoaL-like aldol condensation-catalyzing enzyme